MIATHGGLVGGYGLYIREGKLKSVYKYFAVERYPIASTAPLPKGMGQLKIDFAHNGAAERLGKGAAVTMMVKSHEGRRPADEDHSAPNFGPQRNEHRRGRQLGRLPFKFTGNVEKVTIELKISSFIHLAGQVSVQHSTWTPPPVQWAD